MFPFAPWPQTPRLSSSSSKSIASAISVAPRVRQITVESQIPAQGILSRLSDSGTCFFPFSQTLDRKRVVRILRDVFMHIDNDERQDHLLEINLVHRTQTFDEMCRRINVCAPADMRKQLGEKTRAQSVRSFVISVTHFARLVRKAWSAGGCRAQIRA